MTFAPRYSLAGFVVTATLLSLASWASAEPHRRPPTARWKQIEHNQRHEHGPGVDAGPHDRYDAPITTLSDGSVLVTHGYYFGKDENDEGGNQARWLNDTWIHKAAIGGRWEKCEIVDDHKPSSRWAINMSCV